MQKLKLPNIELPKHQMHLKNVLMERKNSNQSSMNLFKRLLPVALMGMFILSVIHLVPPNKTPDIIETPRANAQVLVEEAISVTRNLSPEEQNALEEKLKTDDVDKLLQDALNAEDLKIVNVEYQESKDLNGEDSSGYTINPNEIWSNAPDEGTITFNFTVESTESYTPSEAIKNSTFLSYTKNGAYCILELNANKTPLMSMIFTPNEDELSTGSEAGTWTITNHSPAGDPVNGNINN